MLNVLEGSTTKSSPSPPAGLCSEVEGGIAKRARGSFENPSPGSVSLQRARDIHAPEDVSISGHQPEASTRVNGREAAPRESTRVLVPVWPTGACCPSAARGKLWSVTPHLEPPLGRTLLWGRRRRRWSCGWEALAGWTKYSSPCK